MRCSPAGPPAQPSSRSVPPGGLRVRAAHNLQSVVDHPSGRQESWRCQGVAAFVGSAAAGYWSWTDLTPPARSSTCADTRSASIIGRRTCGRTAKFEVPVSRLDVRGSTGVDARRCRTCTWSSGTDSSSPRVALGGCGQRRRGAGLDRAARTVEARASPGWITEANWKLSIENFQESHHFPRVHRALEADADGGDGTWLGSGRWRLEPWARGRRDGVARARFRRSSPLVGVAGRVHDAMSLSCSSRACSRTTCSRIASLPLAPDRTRIVFDVWFHPAANPGAFTALGRISARIAPSSRTSSGTQRRARSSRRVMRRSKAYTRSTGSSLRRIWPARDGRDEPALQDLQPAFVDLSSLIIDTSGFAELDGGIISALPRLRDVVHEGSLSGWA